LKVIPCGVEVVLKWSEYHGIITGISIRDKRVTYEVSYYEAGTYKSTWLCDYEFTTGADQSRVVIGFNNTKQPQT